MEWVKRWKTTISAEPILPGVWKRKDGGFVVRGSKKDPRTGLYREVRKVLTGPEYDAPDGDKKALVWLTQALDEEAKPKVAIPSWKRFAASVFEAKLADGTIQSAKGRQKWAGALVHLGEAPWADYLIDQIKHAHIVEWRNSLPKLRWQKRGKPPQPYEAATLNGWLDAAAVVFKEATLKFDLDRNPFEGVKKFVKTGRTYTREQPNSLTPGEAGRWLERFRELFPHYYAMVFIGLVHGARPSSLRPLRRKGQTPDVILDGEDPRLLIRRSHTIGQEVWDQTKTKKDLDLALHPEVAEVIKWHIETQLTSPAQQRSELLFPNPRGEFESPSCLQVPFKEVTAACKLKKKITPRALRRTFQDLTRAAKVEGVVTRAISGHATDAMREHYSTAADAEVVAAVGQVIDLAKWKAG